MPEPDISAIRNAVLRRDRTVAEIMRRAHNIGLPISTQQARLAYDITTDARNRSEAGE